MCLRCRGSVQPATQAAKSLRLVVLRMRQAMPAVAADECSSAHNAAELRGCNCSLSGVQTQGQLGCYRARERTAARREVGAGSGCAGAALVGAHREVGRRQGAAQGVVRGPQPPVPTARCMSGLCTVTGQQHCRTQEKQPSERRRSKRRHAGGCAFPGALHREAAEICSGWPQNTK